MRTISWADAAKRDLTDIDDWYEQRDPQYADKVGQSAIAAARLITEFPHAGAALDGTQVRKWIIPGTDYWLIYLLTESRIEIVRVRHARENWREEV